MSAQVENEAVAAYLRYYIDAGRAFDYAVLLQGRWGSGKTYFLREFLDRSETKSLYVSLYGLSSTSQIDEELYRQLHPVLSSKGMRLAGRVAKAVLRGTLRVDLDKDGKPEGSVNVGLPDIDLSKEMNNPGERLLVFDDLERCKMPIVEVLGYINSFVEHDGIKAIIIANEDEIVEKLEPRYREIKEKLIGQTLTVSPATESALNSFVEGIDNIHVQAFLKSRREDILALHCQCGTQNLRTLKQSLWDYERVAQCFTEAHWKHDAAMEKVMGLVLAIAMEVRSGRLHHGQIGRLVGQQIGRIMRRQNSGQASPEDLVEERYSGINFNETILSAEILEHSLLDGRSCCEAIRSSLDGSHYFSSPTNQPLWLRAWNSYHATDIEAQELAAKLEAAFSRREFDVPGEVLHVIGIRLWFSKIGLVDQAPADVVRESKGYIDDIDAQGRIPPDIDEDEAEGHHGYWKQHGFMEKDTDQFKEVASYYASMREKVSLTRYLGIALELSRKMLSDPTEFLRDLCHNQYRSSPYAKRPVLAAIPSAYFAELVSVADSHAQTSALETLNLRYETGGLDRDLRLEKQWLIDMSNHLRVKAEASMPMTKYRLLNAIGRNIAPILSSLSSDA
jgi:hypothetical protein